MTSDRTIRFSLPDITDAEVEAAVRALRSGWITTGGECAALEQELAEHLGAGHVVAMASCTHALEVAAAYLRLPRGSRIGVPTWTFVSSALAPYHRGLVPVLLDVDRHDLNLSAESLARAIEHDDLSAVVGVHFGGVPLSERVHELCRDAGLPLIEDAAHAMGTVDHRGAMAGRGTAGACLSFYATKNLTSAEGGALVTDDPDLAAFAESFRLHGLSRDAWARYLPGARTAGYDLVGDGLKANLPDVLAAVARVQLARFEQMQGRRRELVLRYRARLGDVDGLGFVPGDRPDGCADHLMVVVLPDDVSRDAVQATMADHGIGTSVHFRPLHRFAWFAEQGIGTASGGTPVADLLEQRVLSLPLHPVLTFQEVDRICDVLLDSLRS
ncbi:MAG: DegT/DnrJ/EryC1/StrS family aminotransferase [Microthrixaceae bacterium]